MVKMKISLGNLYGRRHDLVERYGVSVSQLTSNMFRLSSIRSFPRSVCNKNNTADATSGAGIVHLRLLPEFNGVCVAQSLVFSVVLCRSLFVSFLLAIR
jgi:hypothetical protein